MQQWIKTAAISVIFTLSLAACAPPAQNAYVMGERNFKIQNYHLAFQNLIMAANAGIPDAQYAVGYMYYYGLGVMRSEPLAVYWMQEAARNGQPAAINVMKSIAAREVNPVLMSKKQEKQALSNKTVSLAKPAMHHQAAKVSHAVTTHHVAHPVVKHATVHHVAVSHQSVPAHHKKITMG